MSKVTIDKVFNDAKETKFGPRAQLSIKIKESVVKDINEQDVEIGGNYIRGFFPAGFIAPFKQGDVVDLLIIKKGEYLNFTIPGVGKPPTPDLQNIVERIKKLEDKVFGETRVPEEDVVLEPDIN